MVHKALALPVTDLPRLPSLLPPASLSECDPMRCTRGYCSPRGSRKLALGAKVICSFCISVKVNAGQGQNTHFMLLSFLCLRRVTAHHTQPYCVFLLLPVFFCCAARLPCKIQEFKDSDPSSIAGLLRVHTKICNTAFTEVQKCNFQPFYNFILVLPAHIACTTIFYLTSITAVLLFSFLWTGDLCATVET